MNPDNNLEISQEEENEFLHFLIKRELEEIYYEKKMSYTELPGNFAYFISDQKQLF